MFFLIQKALPRLRDNGRIVTLSSGLSRFANPIFTAYSGPRAAIDVDSPAEPAPAASR